MTDNLYLIKYLTSEQPFTSKFIELHATNPRDAAATFARLIPRGVVIDVFLPPVPPEEWVPPSGQQKDAP